MKKFKFLIIAVIVSLLAGCSDNNPIVQPPIFTNPDVKLATLSKSSFMQQLLDEAVALEPIVTKSGAQMHMGYWSGAGNHGSLVRVLDAINATPSSDTPPQRAIWDEGSTSSIQYPQYVLMNNEFWYERAYFTDGVGTIRGITYKDPYVVTPTIADEIWGAYSQRYAEMATPIKAATDNKVKVWCFVNGAKRNRIFFTYEFPKLQKLEAAGTVRVFFAKTIDADWTVADDWKEGTKNAPTPADAGVAVYPSSAAPVVSAEISDDIAFEIADAYLDGEFGTGSQAKVLALAEFERRNPGFFDSEYEEAFERNVILAAQ